jgi:hypothetical protein
MGAGAIKEDRKGEIIATASETNKIKLSGDENGDSRTQSID